MRNHFETLIPISKVTGGFWAARMASNRAAIRIGYQRLVDAGSIGNLRIAAGEATGSRRPR